jgi:sulfatase modifying factor 1
LAVPLEQVQIPGGTFLMGTADSDGFPADGEGPVRPVTVDPYAIGTTAITNEQFATFVAETAYVTEAERFGWGFVFAGFLPAAARRVSPRVPEAPWWCGVTGADWRRPEGLLPVGRRSPSHRGRVGTSSPWRPRPAAVPLG